MAPRPRLLRAAVACISIAFLAGCERAESPVAPSPTPVSATQSSQGKIAFTSDRDGNSEIYVMNADGSGVMRLTDNPAVDQDPAWSPDGNRIAFTSTRGGHFDIYVMNADGTGVTQLTTTTTHNGSTAPAWCGNRIAFESDRYIEMFPDVYVMNDDGTDVTRLTIDNASFDRQPAWSPTCDRIAFTKDPSGNVEIYVMNADGTGVTRLTNSLAYDQDPAWSPDGTRIAFTSTRDGDPNREIYVMNADGSGATRLTNNPAWDANPAWSPDGSQIAFDSNRDGHKEIYVMSADGTNLTRLTGDSATDVQPAWFGPHEPPPPPPPPPPGPWTTKAPMPTPRWGLGVGNVNGVLYAVGGAGTTLAVEAYDPATDSWSVKSSMRSSRQQGAVGVVNGILYAVGGFRDTPIETMDAYDPRTNTWTARVNMPTPRQGLAVGVVNDILYAVGGDNSSGYLSTVEAYDPAVGYWTRKAPMPTARSGLAVGVVNGILYAIGGNGLSTTVEAYNPATDTWTTKAPMPTGRRSLAVGVVNGIIYALGGDGQPGALATVEAYDPATDTWTTKPSMINPRESLGAGVVNGVLYAIGGYNINSFDPVAPIEAYASGAPPDSPPWPNEPTGLALFNDQPWNSLTGSHWNWERHAGSKDPDIVTDATAPFSPQSVLRMIFTPDMGQDQEPSVHWLGLPGVKELYTGWWLQLSPNWTSSAADAGKMTALFTNQSGQAYTGLYHPCAWPENCSPEQTGPPYKVGAILAWAPYDSVWYPNVVATPVNPGEWHRIEFYYRWESTPGARDGILRWWVDGTLNGNYTDVQYPADNFVEFQYAPTLHDPPPAGVETYMYIDHTHISTRP